MSLLGYCSLAITLYIVLPLQGATELSQQHQNHIPISHQSYVYSDEDDFFSENEDDFDCIILDTIEVKADEQFKSGEYKEANKLYYKIINSKESEKLTEWERATIFYKIGDAYYKQKKYDFALQAHAKGLRKRQAVLPPEKEKLLPEHIDLADSYRKIAHSYYYKGEEGYSSAQKYYKKALYIYKRLKEEIKTTKQLAKQCSKRISECNRYLSMIRACKATSSALNSIKKIYNS